MHCPRLPSSRRAAVATTTRRAAASSPPTDRAPSARSPRRPPRTGRRTEAGTSPSASPAPAAGSSASARARPTSRTRRAQIDEEEAALCEEDGVEYVELQVATDALTNVVNLENDWVDVPDGRAARRRSGSPDSKVSSWNQVDPSYPGRPAQALRPGHRLRARSTTSPTSSTARRARAAPTSRPARTTTSSSRASQANEGGLGYFGFSYFEENQDTLKALEVDGGGGCVAPSVDAAQDGSYTPLARPLFMYVKLSSLDGQRVGLGVRRRTRSRTRKRSRPRRSSCR